MFTPHHQEYFTYTSVVNFICGACEESRNTHDPRTNGSVYTTGSDGLCTFASQIMRVFALSLQKYINFWKMF